MTAALAPAAEAFLRAHGYGDAARHPLPGDAGRRRYARLTGGPAPALLADCSAEPAADLHAFARVAGHLRTRGVRAPAVLARDDSAGLMLVEDLGPSTMAEALDAGADPVPLYAAAGRALRALRDVPPLPDDLPRWDGAAMADAAGATFLEWWWPAAMGGRAPDAATRAAFREAVRETVAPFEARPRLVHRDYFPANLVPLPDGGGVGVLDVQDAALGHPAYDLASLVEDARRDVSAEARAAALAAWGMEADTQPAMAALGAVRHLRVAALWVRLARRDGKPRYLAHGPRCWALLSRCLAHPAAAPLSAFLDSRVPVHLRANPPSPESSSEVAAA